MRGLNLSSNIRLPNVTAEPTLNIMRNKIQNLIEMGKELLLKDDKIETPNLPAKQPDLRPSTNGGGLASASRVAQFNAIETMVEIEIDLPKMRTLLDQMDRQLKDAILPGSVCRARLNPYYTLVARKESRVSAQTAAELAATAVPSRGTVNQ